MIIATLMVPGQILLVPVYLILNKLHWIDTPLALIVPALVQALLESPRFKAPLVTTTAEPAALLQVPLSVSVCPVLAVNP